MSFYDKFIKALEIFRKYEHDQFICAEHDEIYAGPDPTMMTDEDVEALEELGWLADLETWHLFV